MPRCERALPFFLGEEREGGRKGQEIRTCEASFSLLLGRVILHPVGGLDDEDIRRVLVRNLGRHKMPWLVGREGGREGGRNYGCIEGGREGGYLPIILHRIISCVQHAEAPNLNHKHGGS